MKSSSLTLEDIQKEIFEAEVYLNKSHTYISSFGDEGKFENNNNDGSFIQYEKDIGESYKEYLQQYQLSANYSSLYLDDHLSSDDNHLTFNPSLPETSNQIVACMKGRYFPPHQRLYDEAKVKDDKLITLNLRLDELRIQTITHRPKLNNFITTRSPTFQPLHERVPDILKERDLKRRMKEEIESIEHSRLKCKSFNTRSVPANTSDPIELLDVSTRLLMRGKLMEERRLRQIQDAEEKLSETIRPPILTGHKVTAALIAAGNSVLR